MSVREGVVYDMPEAEYHAGAAELSATGAKLLLDAPARYKHAIVEGNRQWKKAWDIGTAVHSKVLGVGQQVISVPEKYLTKSGAKSTSAEAKEWEATQTEAGLIVLKQSEIDEINQIAESLLASADARAMLELEGENEVSVFSTCPETGARLRGRFDRLPTSFDVGVDIKTVGRSGAASDTEFAKQIFNFGYDVQAAQYADTLNYIDGRVIDFAFLVVETVAPYLVNVIAMDTTYMEMGRAKSMEARRRYAHGIETGEWPGYAPGIKRVEPPMFAIYDYQDNYEGSL